MTGAALSLAVPAAAAADSGIEYGHVLDGIVLDGPAARLAGMLDAAFLAEAGWDPVALVLSLPAGHRLLGRVVCQAGGCIMTARTGLGGVCRRCSGKLGGQELTAEQTAASAAELPLLLARAGRCAVPGCQREPTAPRAALCREHARQRGRRDTRPAIGEFLADPRVRPLPPLEPCAVAVCARGADHAHGHCGAHYQRWLAAVRAGPGLDAGQWQKAEPAVAETGQVSLHELPPLVIVQVLFGIWQRAMGGAKITDSGLRMACRALARQQVTSVEELDIGCVPNGPVRSLLRAMAGHVRLALADPASEQAKDTWDLAVFGLRGQLAFAGITQQWLRQAARQWVAEELPRHRGKGAAGTVQQKVRAAAHLSQSLRARPDRGDRPAALGRADIVNFLNRLGYLESAGTISRYHRNLTCRGARAVLTGIRGMGLTRAGQAAAGLPGDFTIGTADIPAEPERGEPCRDLPPEIMAVLCASLDALGQAEIIAATKITIDTGRRPEEILGLPLDCLARDKDGSAALVYDNAKAGLGRRLPVTQATAAVITSQQARVRARFPGTPLAGLKLLPRSRANPDGSKPVSLSMLETRHREWVARLGVLRTRDGTEFDTAKIVPYAYRHTYVICTRFDRARYVSDVA